MIDITTVAGTAQQHTNEYRNTFDHPTDYNKNDYDFNEVQDYRRYRPYKYTQEQPYEYNDNNWYGFNQPRRDVDTKNFSTRMGPTDRRRRRKFSFDSLSIHGSEDRAIYDNSLYRSNQKGRRPGRADDDMEEWASPNAVPGNLFKNLEKSNSKFSYLPTQSAKLVASRLLRKDVIGKFNCFDDLIMHQRDNREAVRFKGYPALLQALVEGNLDRHDMSIIDMYCMNDRDIKEFHRDYPINMNILGPKAAKPNSPPANDLEYIKKCTQGLGIFAAEYWRSSAIMFTDKLRAVIQEMLDSTTVKIYQPDIVVEWIDDLISKFFECYKLDSHKWNYEARLVSNSVACTHIDLQQRIMSYMVEKGEYNEIGKAQLDYVPHTKQRNRTKRKRSGPPLTDYLRSKIPLNEKQEQCCLQFLGKEGCKQSHGNEVPKRTHWFPDKIPSELLNFIKSKYNGLNPGFHGKSN